MEKIEIGYTVPKERWIEAANNLKELANVLVNNLLIHNSECRGKEDADDLMADFALACIAMNHVAEYAVDKCRFIPVSEHKGTRQKEEEKWKKLS